MAEVDDSRSKRKRDRHEEDAAVDAKKHRGDVDDRPRRDDGGRKQDKALPKTEKLVEVKKEVQGNPKDEKPRRRRWDQDEPQVAAGEDKRGVKRERADGAEDAANGHQSNGGAAGAKKASISLDALAKAKLALQKQKELQEKLKKMPQLAKLSGLSAAARPVAPVTVAVPAVPAPIAAAPTTVLQQQAQQAALQRARMLGVPLMPATGLFVQPDEVLERPSKAPVLRLDHFGREIDEHGNVLEKKGGPISTLKVNINKQKKDAFQVVRLEDMPEPEESDFYDPRMAGTAASKKKLLRPKRREFLFVEEGQWTKQAELERLRNQFGEAKAREMRAKQALLSRERNQSDNVNPNLIEVGVKLPLSKEAEKPKEEIPEVEWWDKILLPNGTYDDIKGDNFKIKSEKITIYVEHPVPIDPPAEAPPPPPQPLKLTKKEQKKLRTQTRLAKEKEKQEMIRQGLLEPPKPKVKISNLMKVLGTEATQDPTKLEQEVRSQMAERQAAHEDRNLARKLTPAERREKKNRKLFEDSSTVETVVAVFRVLDMSHPQHKFKVDVNAQENRITGALVITDEMSVVVAEGGAKSLKRYQKLMLRRINWNQAAEEVADDEEEDPAAMTLGKKGLNKCVMVWQGSVARPAFKRFSIQQSRTEAAARKFLTDFKVEHYWDLAANFPDD